MSTVKPSQLEAWRKASALSHSRARWGGVRAKLVRRRLLLAIPQLLIVSSLTFVLVSLSPGDPARTILGLQATPESIERLRGALGLDHPVWVQYWDWLVRALHGDLGSSITSQQHVTEAIAQRMPVTLSLVLGALLVTSIVGVGIGVLSALRGGPAVKVLDSLALAGFAVPSFWLATGLIAIFAVKLKLFPAVGYVPFGDSPSDWLRSLVLPIISLAVAGAAVVARQTREAMTSVIGSEYVRMARVHGVRLPSLVLRYELRNAAIPVVTVIGTQFVGLLAGTVFVEKVFALPGLGSLMVEAALTHDLPILQGVTVTFTLMVIGVNLLIDLLYSWLNPKVKMQ